MTHVDWHPYPEDMPKKPGCYLVTYAEYYDLDNFNLYVDFRYFSEEKLFVNEFDEWDLLIIAWAEMPEPYRPPEPEDNHPDAITARKYMSGDPETVKALHIFDE